MTACFGRQNRLLRAGAFEVSETVHQGGLVTPRHEHSCACLHFVLEGEYRESSAKTWLCAGPGSVVTKPPGLTHSNRFGTSGARTLRIAFDPSSLDIDRRAMDEWNGLSQSEAPDAAALCRLQTEVRRPDDLTPVVAEGLCSVLVGTLMRVRRHERCTRRETARLGERCAAVLLDSLESTPDLDALAASFGVHRSTLCRAFQAHHGCSVGAFVRAARVRRVIRLIEDSDLSVAQAAARAGFADHSHCTRVFRAVTGTTPSRWRGQGPG